MSSWSDGSHTKYFSDAPLRFILIGIVRIFVLPFFIIADFSKNGKVPSVSAIKNYIFVKVVHFPENS